MNFSRGMASALLAASLTTVVAADPAHAGSCVGTNGSIAFDSSRDGTSQIYRADADGSNQTRLTSLAMNAQNSMPAWSPDGTKIAFASTRDGNSWDIYVMNSDGSQQTRVTNNPALDWDPVWSPDGSRIAFVSKRDGSEEIYVMNADGTDQTRLTSGGTNSSPSWSPDGSKFAFVSGRNSQSTDIYVMNADGSAVTRLTDDTPADAWPAWSPDGTKIAFANTRLREGEGIGDDDIWVMNSDGSSQTRLTDDPGNESHPAWSPDGSKILYAAYGGSILEYRIRSMSPDGTNQTTPIGNKAGDPAWQPVVSGPLPAPIQPGSIRPSSGPLPIAATGQRFSGRLTASSGQRPYRWTVASGQPPAGLSLRTTGTFAGVPTTPGTTAFTARVTDAKGQTASAIYCVTVVTMTVATKSLPAGLVSKRYSQTLKAIGGSRPIAWTVSEGSVPSGLKLSARGSLSGTPTSVGTFTFTATATDSAGLTATRDLTLQIQPMTVTTNTLPNAVQGDWYSTGLKVIGGKGSHTWSLSSGSLPTGLKLTPSGRISGKPTTPGTYDLVVRVTDASAPPNVATRAFTIVVT